MPDLPSLLRVVDADRLMRHVRQITRAERSPDSAGEREAFAYIGNELSACGLVANLHHLPGYVSMPERARFSVGGESIPCTTHSMLPSATCETELIYIPNARSLGESGQESERKSEVAGKIVLTEGLAMVPVMQAAQNAGAVAVVCIAGSRHHHEMIVSAVWGSPEPDDLDKYLTIPAITISHGEGERVKKLMRDRGAAASLHTQVSTRWTEIPVITADIGPVDRGYLLLTGHVDSWHKGAMDNASGNAAVLEIARLLAERTPELQRGVRVAMWSGHSHGRYAGSTAFCDECFHDLYENAFLHVNADCLGAQGASLLTQSACMAETWALGNFAVQTVAGQTLEGSRFGRSCDQAFWGTGTPSLFSSVSEQPKPATDDAASKAFSLMFGGTKSGGYGWWWHTIADTEDKILPDILQRDTRIILAAVYRACTEPVLPIDIWAGFSELASHINAYAQTASPWLSFAPLLREVERIATRLRALDLNQYDADRANALIQRFEQKLVPLMHVKGKIYGHDPALRQCPVPLLEDVLRLPDMPAGHAKNALLILLKRRMNEVQHRLRELASLLEKDGSSFVTCADK